MKFFILFFGAFCDGSRNISDAEYQNFYSGVVEVSEIYAFDRFQFKNQVSRHNTSSVDINYHSGRTWPISATRWWYLGRILFELGLFQSEVQLSSSQPKYWWNERSYGIFSLEYFQLGRKGRISNWCKHSHCLIIRFLLVNLLWVI